MGRRKYPDGYINLINFETGTTDLVPEANRERKARLRREWNVRTRAVHAEFRAVAKAERRNALNKAYRLAYAGKSFPIHYDIEFVKGKVRKIERVTVVDAVFGRRIDKKGEVGTPSATTFHSSRSADIPPDFVHRVRMKSD